LVAACRQVADKSLAEQTLILAWASGTTLVGAAPLGLGHGEFLARLLSSGRERGASMPVMVAPSERVGHVGDGQWSSLSARLDADGLQVGACFNPAEAARVGLGSRESGLAFRYDDGEARLALEDSQGHGVEINVQFFGLVAICSGVLPEEFIAAAVEEAWHRLHRLQILTAGLHDSAGAEGIQFLDGVPVIVTEHRIVLDPGASDYLAGSDEYEFRAADVLEARLNPPCTCSEPRVVSAALRPRAAVYSFDSKHEPPDWLFVPILDQHCLIFELACPHAAVRPSAEQWLTVGWDIARCTADWEETPAPLPIDCVRESKWSEEAVLVLGREISATAAKPRPASALLHRLGFEPGTAVTLYAANANLLLASTGSFENEDAIRASLNARFFGVLERLRRPAGREVSFLVRRKVEDVAALATPVNEIPLSELTGVQTH
jgi:hypothetical protein